MAERDKKDKKDKRHKKHKAASVAVSVDEDAPETPVSKSSAPVTPVKDALSGIDLNNISPLEQLQHRQHHQVSDAPKPTAAPLSPAAPAAAGPAAAPAASSSSSKDKERHHKHKDKKHKHSSKSKSSVTTRTLYKDSGLLVTYDHRAVADKKMVSTTLTFTNKGQSPVFNVELDLNDAQTPIRWARPSPGPQALNLTLAAGASATKELLWAVNSCVQPLKIAGKLAFIQQKEADKAGVPVNANVDVIVPCSAYLTKQAIDQPTFVSLLRGPLAQSIATTALTATVPQVLDFLGKDLGMHVIEDSASRGSLFGVTILGHQVAVLVKEEGAQDALALAVKASDDTLGQSLLREIASLCNKQ